MDAPGKQPHPAPQATPEAATEHAGHESIPGMGNANHNLFQSDMALMTGMTPNDEMAGMAMPGWHVMALGVARLGYNVQGGPSGSSLFESSSWNMIHVAHDLGGGRLSLMMMNSLELWTFEKRGSPELFQTGESYRGVPLIDRQHPHDLFMNLSATYRFPFGKDAAAWLQLAPVGEPAIGPTAFMHRASSGENPTAPLGHHWQDSTHIAFNVITAGGGWRWLAVEGSAFHGAEPDEKRYDIEGGSVDSAAGRLKVRFGAGWSAQASYAYLHEPEALEPGSTHRTTASIHYGADGDRPLAATLLWGRNNEGHGTSDAWLLEGAWQITGADHAYGRLEWVQKDRHLLEFKGADVHPGVALPEVAEITALTVGYLREIVSRSAIRVGAGADVTGYLFPSGLENVYGDHPVSWHLFLRVRWGRPHGAHSASAHGGRPRPDRFRDPQRPSRLRRVAASLARVSSGRPARSRCVEGSATSNIFAGSRIDTRTAPPSWRRTTLQGRSRPIDRSASSARCASCGLHAPRMT
jgi:hypothetical protein